MPGNDTGDRVHNFFPQDNLSQGQNHQQIVDGNWPVVNNNLWGGSPRQVGVLSSNTNSYNLQHSDIERGQSSHSLHGPQGLNFTHAIPRSEFATNQNQSQQLNLNGDLYGNRFHRTRQNEANFLGVDTASDQHNPASRGSAMYESHQGSAPLHQTKSLFRSGTSESPVSFDLFGSQQQMNHPQLSMLHSLQQQQQQSGFSDMQQLQQQLMLRKMQELQRQQQLRQIDARQQNAVNPLLPYTQQVIGNCPSPLVNGTLSSDSLNNSWGTELGNMNWLQRASPVMQGSSNGFVFSSNHGQEQCIMDLGPQQGDQSLYGVPVSGFRGNTTQFSKLAEEKPLMQQMATFGNSSGNQYNVSTEQAIIHDGSLISGQRSPGDNFFAHSSGEALNQVMNMENLQQVNPMQRNASLQEIQDRQELVAQQEQTLAHGATSRNGDSLDPTEERILFGSDDNIWDAFGKSSNMSGDPCDPFDSEGANGVPSFQSGTWSALMQSAVAETSDSDIGLQEEWSGLNFQNTVVPPENHHPTTYDEEQQTSFANDSMPSSLNSLPSNFSSMNNSYQNVLGFHQLANKFECEPDRRLHPDSSLGPVNLSDEGSKWSKSSSVQNTVAEASPNNRKVSHSLGAETAISNPFDPWASLQSLSRLEFSKPNDSNVLRPVARNGDASASMHESENSSQHSQGNEPKGFLHGKVVRGGSVWKSSSIPSSNVETGQVKSPAGSFEMNRDGFNVNSAAGIPNSSTQVNEETSQYPSNSYLPNYWQNFNPAVKSQGSESAVVSHHLNKDNQPVYSLFKSRYKEEVEASEIENYNERENSSDSHRSNLSRHNWAGGSRENVFSDVSDSRALPSRKQKSADQIGWKNSGPRKFQYHPMGNLDEDVEPPYGLKQPSHLLAMSQQSTQFGQSPKNSAELAKVQSADQKDAKSIDDTPARGSLYGHVQSATTPFNQSDMYTSDKDSQSSSQNMLELLHKVDPSKEQGLVMQYCSTERNLSSEMPEAENSNDSVGHLQRNRSSASQGYGLQLGPPSYQTAVPNQLFASQSSVQTVNTLHQSLASPEFGEKGQSQFTSSVQSGVVGQVGDNAFMHKISGALNSGFSCSRSELHNQQTVRAREHISANEHDASHSVPKEGSLSRPSTGQTMETRFPDAQISTNNPHARSSAVQTLSREPARVLQPWSASGNIQQGASSKRFPNMWGNVSGQPHLLGAQFHKESAHVPQSHQTQVIDSTYCAPYKQGDQDVNKGRPSESAVNIINKESFGQQVSLMNVNPVLKLNESQGSGPVLKYLSDASPANSASKQKELEAFSRSLKSKNVIPQNDSFLNQMQALNSGESDPNERILKRMEGPESVVDAQQVALRAAGLSENSSDAVDELTHTSAVPSVDSNVLNFSEPLGKGERKSFPQHGNVALQNLLDVSDGDSRSNPHENNPVRVEHSHISPQMAPSWFSQYGTFRNGQMLAMYDARRATMMRTVEQPFTLGKSSNGSHALNSMEPISAAVVGTSHVGSIRPSSTSTSGAHFSSPQSLPLKVLRPKKRKRATSKLVPWHKELSHGPQNLQTISMGEVAWAKAANRLIERVKDEVEWIKDGTPILRAKKRLTLTTQLMQQLLRPPQSAILSADADSNYENVTYSISRLALGDACGLACYSSSDSDMPCDSLSLLSDKCNKSERVDDRHLLKDINDFMERAQKLENDFLRLDRRASILDLRVESQELEKISVINRFAKFHGRGQAESGDASSSADAAANALRFWVQRYVHALPIPKNLPDRVQCLSL